MADKKPAIITPYFQIKIEGETLSPLLHSLVQSVTFTDSSSEASTATIIIQDPDYILLDDPRLVRNTKVQLYGGLVNDNEEWLTGYISAVDVQFPEDGTPTITIMVMDESFEMDSLPKYAIFQDMWSSEIAEKIAQIYGLKFVGDKGIRQYKHKVQSKQTDIKFLRAMADQEWYIVKIMNGTLYWLERSFSKGEDGGTFWYRRPPFDLLSFNPRLVQADRLDGVIESGIDPATGQPTTEVTGPFNLPDIAALADEVPSTAGYYYQYDKFNGGFKKVYVNEEGVTMDLDSNGNPITGNSGGR
jgi:hypothetical protein